MNYEAMIAEISKTVRPHDGTDSDLQNAVFEAVCGFDPEVMEQHLEQSDDWAETGRYSERFPADSLGEWPGADVSSVQDILESVYDEVSGA